MALTPKTPNNLPAEGGNRKDTGASQEEVLMREVDEAVRQDELSDFLAKYGKPLLGVVVAGLAAFAVYLFYWVPSREGPLEEQSETLTRALDQVGAGNLDSAETTLAPVATDGDAGAKAAAALLQAGIALEKNKPAEAAKIYAAVAADDGAPKAMRDLATVREIATTFDSRKPEDIITRLKPLAVPGNAYFGSAGEMVAMAYVEQGKRKEAGTLFASIAKSEDVPDSLRGRARDMAGLLGVDAIEDVDKLLKESGARNDAPTQQ
ncbi:MAG: tetratricopeptide repeat protein [Pontixanthobacter sp.]